MKTVYHEADPDTMYHLEDLSRFLLFMLTLICLLYTSDAADEEDSVDLGGRRIIKKKNKRKIVRRRVSRPKTKH